jgi:hypothetical protein
LPVWFWRIESSKAPQLEGLKAQTNTIGRISLKPKEQGKIFHFLQIPLMGRNHPTFFAIRWNFLVPSMVLQIRRTLPIYPNLFVLIMKGRSLLLTIIITVMSMTLNILLTITTRTISKLHILKRKEKTR